MYTKIPTAGISHEEWLKLRKNGIGGSDAAAVCGLNPYSSPMKVFIDKISEEITDNDNEAMRQGRDLENYVAQRFTEETGIKVRRSNYMYRSNAHPFMLADVDRLLVGCDAGLECKTASAYSADKWSGDNVPLFYYLQCQHYLCVTGKKEWYIAVLIMGKEFKYQKIERDEELIQNLVILEERFWNDYVLAGHMPDPDGSKACDEILEEYFKISKKESAIPLVATFDEKLRRRNEISQLIEKLETERNQIEQEVKAFMGENELAYNDHYRVSWASVETSRIDTKLLKEKEPEVYEKYLRLSKGRRFSVKAA